MNTIEQQPELDLGEEKAVLEARLEEIKKIEAARAAAARIESLKPVIAAIREHGFTAAELGLFSAKSAPAAEKPAKPPVPAKYHDPVSGKEWTGRGVLPVWLARQVEAGKTKEDFLINPPAATVDEKPAEPADRDKIEADDVTCNPAA